MGGVAVGIFSRTVHRTWPYSATIAVGWGGAIDLQFLCNEEYIVCSKNISNKQYTLCSKNKSNAHTHRPTHGPTGIPYGRHRKHNNNTHKYTYTQEHIHRHIDTGTPIECSTCNLQGTLWKVTFTFIMVDSLPSSKVCSNTFCSAHQAQHHPRAPPWRDHRSTCTTRTGMAVLLGSPRATSMDICAHAGAAAIRATKCGERPRTPPPGGGPRRRHPASYQAGVTRRGCLR